MKFYKVTRKTPHRDFILRYLDTCTNTVIYLSEHGIYFSHIYPFSLGTEVIEYGRLINRNDINYIRVMRGIGEREKEKLASLILSTHVVIQ